ncbi:hypothetical protein DFO66_101112 [Brevibacterium sanguinis]|uniref:DUF4439 domain-containing protein n=2 Tax=Brevibacterium TaxID=1696 RepID=A0A366IQA4_9MICO|nr:MULTISPECIES: hypothetical protein [Brevibacterium]RBP67891.1 hypothetical protein DFO66_101112 [Brevibacterium sanguinis]RBP74692.1 hypothetical protein DFO65_101417 [Brevibacterium celere]
MRFPVSRRTVLLTGLAAASLGPLSACGLRWDTAPDVPDLDSSDELRNRIARILEHTAPGPDDPESATADLESLRTAVGPAWAPPTELATASPSAEPQRTYREAAEVVSTAVFDAVAGLDSGLIPVLVDTATGFALTAGADDPELIGTAEDLLMSRIEEAMSDAAASPGSAETDTAGPDSAGPGSAEAGPADPEDCAAILDAARAASYGYERLAVKFAEAAPERGAALARLETLGSLAGQMLEMLAAADADPAPDSPSWALDPVPTDEGSARELALGLEDGVAAALLPWLRVDPLAAGRLWESARARSVFGAAQALRFTYADSAAEAGS